MVEGAEAEWRDAQHQRGYLLRNPQLANAMDLDRRWGPELTPELRTFVAASRSRARAGLVRAAAVIAVMILILAGLTGYAVVQQQAANAQRLLADANAAEATEQRQTATANESRALAALAASDVTSDPVNALKLALAAWPRDAQDNRPQLEATIQPLANSIGRIPVRQFVGNKGQVTGAVFSKDDSRILSWSTDGTVRLWDAATGAQIGAAMKHDDQVNGAVFSKDESRILSWSADGTLRLWDASWPHGTIFDVACALLPDHDLTSLSTATGIQITDPICDPAKTIPAPDWSKVEGLAP